MTFSHLPSPSRGCIAGAPPLDAAPLPPLPVQPAPPPPAPAAPASIDIYLGNGCFWERQWAYYVVETDRGRPFGRPADNFTAIVGYAGGRRPTNNASEVCYHSGDARDYSTLGHAEVTQVSLDPGRQAAQMRALAADYFSSFVGPNGQRTRPDAGDIGPAYRSVVGLPGGVRSPLYPTFAAENIFGMRLVPSVAGGDADAANTVYVYDSHSDALPFWPGEVYHQCHCNFFPSAGMPYPTNYTRDVWTARKLAGDFVPTGCPEGVFMHPGAMCP